MHGNCSNLPDRVLARNKICKHALWVAAGFASASKKSPSIQGYKHSFIILALTCIIIIITIVIILLQWAFVYCGTMTALAIHCEWEDEQEEMASRGMRAVTCVTSCIQCQVKAPLELQHERRLWWECLHMSVTHRRYAIHHSSRAVAADVRTDCCS